MSLRVAWLSFTPVKATMLHVLDEAEVLESGLRGDRRFYLITATGRLVSNKDVGMLQQVRADYDAEADVLVLRLPTGDEVAGEVVRGGEVATTFHRRPRTARLVDGPWAEAVSELLGEPVRLVEPGQPAPDRGRAGAVTVLARGSLERLGSELGVDGVDHRRFRMNVGIDGLEAHAEDAWRGRRLRLGEAVVVPQGHVGRCVVTTQNPATGVSDLATLDALARYRRDLETTEALAFGIHAAVVEPGRLRVGDPVELL